MKTKTTTPFDPLGTTFNNPTAHQLNAAFAAQCVGLKKVGLQWGSGPEFWHRIGPAMDPKDALMEQLPDYIGSPSLVLPILAQAERWECSYGIKRGKKTYRIYFPRVQGEAEEKTFARAAVVACLRSIGCVISP